MGNEMINNIRINKIFLLYFLNILFKMCNKFRLNILFGNYMCINFKIF